VYIYQIHTNWWVFNSFRGVALTNCVTDRTKTICLPIKVRGDIIVMVGSKGTICSCAYYQEIVIAWILWELCPFELRNFPKFTTEAACQHNSSETTKQNFMCVTDRWTGQKQYVSPQKWWETIIIIIRRKESASHKEDTIYEYIYYIT
jgi:hypothetical protein